MHLMVPARVFAHLSPNLSWTLTETWGTWVYFVRSGGGAVGRFFGGWGFHMSRGWYLFRQHSPVAAHVVKFIYISFSTVHWDILEWVGGGGAKSIWKGESPLRGVFKGGTQHLKWPSTMTIIYYQIITKLFILTSKKPLDF